MLEVLSGPVSLLAVSGTGVLRREDAGFVSVPLSPAARLSNHATLLSRALSAVAKSSASRRGRNEVALGPGCSA